MEKEYYGTLHLRDSVNGSNVAIGMGVACDDLTVLENHLRRSASRKNKRRCVARIYRQSTGELVSEFTLTA